MRILQVITSVNPAGGGPIEGLVQQSLALTTLGHTVEVVCCDNPSAGYLGSFPLDVHALGPAMLEYSFTPRMKPWLLQNAASYDGVVINGLWQYHSFATAQAMRQMGKPYVVYAHGMLGAYFKDTFPLKHTKKLLYWRWGEYRVLRDAAAVLFTTEEERLSARTSFRPYQAIERVVGYGTAKPVGSLDSHAGEFLEKFPDLKGKQFLLFLGRIHSIKGCDLLIRAFADVCRESQLMLVMAGPDQVGWRAELEAIAVSKGIAARVLWTGMISGDVKWGALRAAQAFILPSHHENFGIVVVEALACATPVLISDKVSIWREIHSAGVGLVCDDTLEGIADMLARWIALPGEDRATMIGKAVKCFDEHFEIGISARSLLKVLEEVRVCAAP